MFGIPDFAFKIAAIILIPVCIFLFINVYSLRSINASLSKENGELTTEIATVRANIELQNKAVAELEVKTEAYKKKLSDAKTKNEESQKQLEKSLDAIKKLTLPQECSGKIEVLKDELIKEAKGWTS